MMHHEKHGRKKARAMLGRAGYKAGGHVKAHPDEAEDKALIKKEVKPSALKKHLKDGGCADGGMAKPRADRLARGGKAKGHKSHTTVNVVVGRSHPQPVPVPKPVPVPVPGGAPGGPMAGPPPGAGPMPPPPDGGGAPPMGLKRGGRAKRAGGGGTPIKDILIGEGLKALKSGGKASDSGRGTKGGIPAGHFKRGGKTYPIEDGAGGGLARMQKAKAYGA